jgi:hypothetical protein
MDQGDNTANSVNQIQEPEPPKGPPPVPENVGEADQPNHADADGSNKNGGNKNWIKHIWDKGPDRQLELIFAAIIAFSAIGQIIVTVINNRGTSKQVDKIITAAKGIQGAATQIQGAAWQFSGSAAGINGGIETAVTQLGNQVEASRTAERAFVVPGSQGTGSLEGFTPTKNTSKFGMHFYYVNVGRSPAISVKVDGVVDLSGKEDSAFLKIPSYDGLTGDALSIEKEQSKILYEGEDGPKVSWGSFRPYALSHPGYSVYGYIQYKDIFGAKHITAFCNYYPFTPTQFNGIRQCLKGNWIDRPPKNPKSRSQ